MESIEVTSQITIENKARVELFEREKSSHDDNTQNDNKHNNSMCSYKFLSNSLPMSMNFSNDLSNNQ